MTWKSTGPLSYQGSGRKNIAQDAAQLALTVHPLDKQDSVQASGRAALVHPDDLAPFAAYLQGAPAFLQLAQGSDFLARVDASAAVARGAMCMEHVQRHNMHVALGETYTFSVWEGPEDPLQLDLVDVSAELRPLPAEAAAAEAAAAAAARESIAASSESDTDGAADSGAASPAAMDTAATGGTDSAHRADLLSDRFAALQTSEPGAAGEAAQLDAGAVARELLRTHMGGMLAANQLVSLTLGGCCWLLRITEANTLDPDARANAIGYHCFRGRLAPGTRVYLHALPEAEGVCLVNAQQAPPPGQAQDVVDVCTSDGEHFPVKKALLRLCIALTAAVRSTAATVHADVAVDTLTFDRVLIFLEALALGKPPPSFGAHLLDDLLAAGRVLGCQSLVSYCEARLGVLQTRIKVHAWRDVLAANARGLCWLTLDGMVLDVTHWLQEHPGGKTIIPGQALNLDCSRFFEVYHASRESFLYLKEFYIGEVEELDLEQIPRPEEPSDDFLVQLRSFTPWRIACNDIKAFKSF